MLTILPADVTSTLVLDVHVPHGDGLVACAIPGLELTSCGRYWLISGETYYLGTNRQMSQWLVTGGTLRTGQLHQLVTLNGGVPVQLPTTDGDDVTLTPTVYTLAWTEDDYSGHWAITAT